ncbi:MAG: carboxypeptidase regulatory-like domain-containing protein, partial [Sphingobacterium sp.]
LEYKADYFKTRPNATVEELLKLLPGLQVNVDGSIYYQGREVSGVRVNNKDFFAQDLKIATRNLDASLIDIVQVIKDKGDSKREINDDSELPIVLNLKMKKEFLKADFGKFYGGAATRDRYESGALMNTFRDTLQVSFIGFANNINRQAFDYSELSQYGGYGRAENNNMVMYGSNGLINQMSAGVNVNYDIAKKLKTNLMYNFRRNHFYNRSEHNGMSFYDDIQEESTSFGNNDNYSNAHEVRAFARYQLDTTAQISYDGRIADRSNEGMNEYSSESWREGTMPISMGSSESSSKGGSTDYNHDLYGEKKFHNKWLLSLRQNLRKADNNSNSQRASLNRYYLQNDSIYN